MKNISTTDLRRDIGGMVESLRSGAGEALVLTQWERPFAVLLPLNRVDELWSGLANMREQHAEAEDGECETCRMAFPCPTLGAVESMVAALKR